MQKDIKRGEIYYADLSGNLGSEQGGIRPVLILQNNIGNKHSPTTLIAPLTSKSSKSKLPTHVSLKTNESNLKQDSIVLFEQVRVIDKNRLKDYTCSIEEKKMIEINVAIMISFGIPLVTM